MLGRARLKVERRGDNRCVVRCLEDAPPVAIRRCQDAFYLVATAAGPIGTDRVAVDVELGDGACVVIRSLGATIAYAGSGARLDVSIVAGEEAALAWLPEPIIATARCDLEVRSSLQMAQSAQIIWREELVLGRLHEPGGRVRHRLRADICGEPLLRHDLEVGPGAPAWDGPAIVGSHRAIGMSLTAGPGSRSSADRSRSGPGWAAMPLDGPGVLAMAVADDLASLRRRLERAGSGTTAPAVPAGAGGDPPTPEDR